MNGAFSKSVSAGTATERNATQRNGTAQKSLLFHQATKPARAGKTSTFYRTLSPLHLQPLLGLINTALEVIPTGDLPGA